ncbi:MAG TPA: VOC family protein [Burkholderiales bacterium]
MKPNPVGWFEIYVQDTSRARKFYESVLGCKLQKLDSPFEIWAFPMEKDVPGAPGALVRMDGVPSGGNSTIVYFATEDCAVEEARVTKAGGEIHKPKFSIGPYGFISLVVDTEGNMIGLHSMK